MYISRALSDDCWASFVTGAYLTESLHSLEFAWPRLAVVEIVLYAILGALRSETALSWRKRLQWPSSGSIREKRLCVSLDRW